MQTRLRRSFFTTNSVASRNSLIAIRSLAGLFTTALVVPIMPTTVWAQDQSAGIPGEVISTGSAPFTDTLKKMLDRDDPYQKALRAGRRPPVSPRPVPNVFEDEEAKREGLEGFGGKKKVQPFGEPSTSFPAPPFLGSIDSNGHFTKDTNSTRSIDGDTKGSGGPNAPQTLGAVSITGLTFNNVGGWYPPDTQGAVGPNHAMIFVNGGVGIYRKSDGVKLSQVSLTAFFTATIGGVAYPQGGAFDPRVVYDRRTGHWFATGMEFGSGEVNNHVILAVSRTSDPTGTWDKYLIPIGVATDNSFTDYSTLGVDDNGVYVAARIFSSSNYAKIAATPKAPLIAASPSIGAVDQWTNITDVWSTPQPALNLDNTANSRAWFVASSTTFNANINYRTLTWSSGVPTLTSTSVLTTPGYAGGPLSAPALGSSANINTGDDRLMMAVIRDNKLWTSRNVAMDRNGGSTSTSNRTGCEWLCMNVTNATATLVQSGRVYDPATSDPRYYYYPTLTISGQGHMALGFSGSKSTEYVGIYTSGRLSTDTLGTTQSILSVKPGSNSYTISDGSRNRWGDYSYTAVDPSDDMTLWTFQEYAAGANNWGTWGQQLKAPAPVATTIKPSLATQGQTGATFQIAGTGFFDPGSGFTNRLTASLSGTGISNVTAIYLSPTLIGIKCDIASTATLGTRSLTLTNPDGQTTTVANALTIAVANPQVTITQTSSRVSGNLRFVYTITNPASATASRTSVKINSATIRVGTTTTNATTTFPAIVGTGTIAPGSSGTVTITFPASVGTAGTAAQLSISGTYTGGSFSSASRITLP